MKCLSTKPTINTHLQAVTQKRYFQSWIICICAWIYLQNWHWFITDPVRSQINQVLFNFIGKKLCNMFFSLKWIHGARQINIKTRAQTYFLFKFVDPKTQKSKCMFQRLRPGYLAMTHTIDASTVGGPVTLPCRENPYHGTGWEKLSYDLKALPRSRLCFLNRYKLVSTSKLGACAPSPRQEWI